MYVTSKLHQRKDTGTWEAIFSDKSRRPAAKRISLRTKDAGVAAGRYTKVRREVESGQRDPWADALSVEEGLTLAEAVRRFIKDRASYCTPATVGTYASILGTFAGSLPATFPLYGVEERHVTAWTAARDLKASSRRHYHDRLRIFYSWAVSQGLVKASPVPKERKSKATRREDVVAYLSEADVEALLRVVRSEGVLRPEIAGANGWLADAVEVAVGTGLRLSELCAMRWSWVDLAGEKAKLTVRNSDAFTTKSGRERVVPLAGRALEVLVRLAAERSSEGDDAVLKGATGEAIGKGYLSARFRHYRKLAGLPEAIHFHSLRHTFASRLVEKGVDLYRVQHLLGHADQKMTQRYSHLKPDGLHAAVEATFGLGLESDTRSEIERLEERLTALRGANP